jgi:peptidoglycan/xylan/chitin deacetylase (PgdA/CDA1 family)
MKHLRLLAKRMGKLFLSLLILSFLAWPLVGAGLNIFSVASSNTSSELNPQDIVLKPIERRSLDQDISNLKPFEEPIITITFDDGWKSIYSNAAPILEEYGIATTQYIITSVFDQPIYMSRAQVLQLHNVGHEIGSHTITHRDLTKLSDEQLDKELAESQSVLSQLIGQPVRHFASPLSAYDARVLTQLDKYYDSHRNTWASTDNIDDYDINTARHYNQMEIISFTVRNDTTASELEALIDYTIERNGWLVLTYHQIETSNNSPFNVTPKQLREDLDLITSKQIRTATIGEVTSAIKQRGQ